MSNKRRQKETTDYQIEADKTQGDSTISNKRRQKETLLKAAHGYMHEATASMLRAKP